MSVVEKRLNDFGDGIVHPLPTPRKHSSVGEQQRQGRSQEGVSPFSVEISDGDDEDGAHEDSTDGMGAIIFADEEDCAFFGMIKHSKQDLNINIVAGPSSNIAFTRHISRAVARLSRVEQQNATPRTNESLQLDGGLMSVSRPPSSSNPERSAPGTQRTSCKQPVSIYAIPPEEETLDLVRRYFSNTGLLFPYLHEESFLETYQNLRRTNFTKIRKTWLSLLNMVLAFATSTTVSNDLSAEKRAEISDVYYERALGLCDKQIFRGTTVELGDYLSHIVLSSHNK